MARLSQGSLNTLKLMSREEKDTLGRAIQLIRYHGPDYLAGDLIDVDTLQLALEGSGFRKADIGNDGYWYKNLTDSIAELKAVSPIGHAYLFIVESNFYCSIILSVENVGLYEAKKIIPSKTVYSHLSFAELQALCKKKKVKAKGTREQLIKNLLWADEHPLVPLTKKEDFLDIKTVKDLMGVVSLLPEGEDTPITVIEGSQGDLYLQIVIKC